MTTTTDGLALALRAELAAIWGYSLVGGKVRRDLRAAAGAAQGMHQTRADRLAGRLVSLHAAVPDPAAAYTVPFPVTDSRSAMRLAVHLEDGTAAAWRYLVAAAESAELRRYAVATLTACAVESMRWRGRAGLPLTQAFPGA